MEDKIKNISTERLVGELILRGARFIDNKLYAETSVKIEKRYSKDRSVEIPNKVLVLDYLSGF